MTAAKLKKNSVTEKKVRDNAITTSKIADGAVTGAKVQAATLGTVPSAATFSGYNRRGMVRVPASPLVANNGAATRAASPEVPLVSTGPFTVYAKCFDFPADTDGAVFIKTSEDGAILEGSRGEVSGNSTYLNRDTPEDARELSTEVANNDRAEYGRTAFIAMAPGGTVIRGEARIAAKRGTPAGGNGLYGPGNVCLFAAEMTALSG